jgi:hypothetical protein
MQQHDVRTNNNACSEEKIQNGNGDKEGADELSAAFNIPFVVPPLSPLPPPYQNNIAFVVTSTIPLPHCVAPRVSKPNFEDYFNQLIVDSLFC